MKLFEVPVPAADHELDEVVVVVDESSRDRLCSLASAGLGVGSGHLVARTDLDDSLRLAIPQKNPRGREKLHAAASSLLSATLSPISVIAAFSAPRASRPLVKPPVEGGERDHVFDESFAAVAATGDAVNGGLDAPSDSRRSGGAAAWAVTFGPVAERCGGRACAGARTDRSGRAKAAADRAPGQYQVGALPANSRLANRGQRAALLRLQVVADGAECGCRVHGACDRPSDDDV